jgi:hypothetical protein
VLTASDDKTARLWEAESGKLQVSVGTLNESLAHLREMLKPATFIRRMLSCSPETNTGTERTKLLATVAEASFRVDESALWLR